MTPPDLLAALRAFVDGTDTDEQRRQLAREHGVFTASRARALLASLAPVDAYPPGDGCPRVSADPRSHSPPNPQSAAPERHVVALAPPTATPTAPGRPKGRQRKAERDRCGARTRDGSPCEAPAYIKPGQLVGNGRCRAHGGASSGPKTPEGRHRSRDGARKGAARRWGK